MNRGSSWLPRLTAKRPASFIASIFFLFQTSVDKPRPRQCSSACSPRNRAVATEGGSLTKSRARKTPALTVCARWSDLNNGAVVFKPGLNRVKNFGCADPLELERYLLN